MQVRIICCSISGAVPVNVKRATAACQISRVHISSVTVNTCAKSALIANKSVQIRYSKCTVSRYTIYKYTFRQTSHKYLYIFAKLFCYLSKCFEPVLQQATLAAAIIDTVINIKLLSTHTTADRQTLQGGRKNMQMTAHCRSPLTRTHNSRATCVRQRAAIRGAEKRPASAACNNREPCQIIGLLLVYCVPLTLYAADDGQIKYTAVLSMRCIIQLLTAVMRFRRACYTAYKLRFRHQSLLTVVIFSQSSSACLVVIHGKY